jgi:hypothetical protein
MNFELDPEYITDVTIRQEWNMHTNKDTITNEDLVEVLKGRGSCSSTHSEDHPEFARLRDRLGELGYISIQRGWWNGDRVLKSFTLNGVAFEPGEQFPSAAPMKFHLERNKQ